MLRFLQQKIQAWFTQPPSTESEDELLDIPKHLNTALVKRLEDSPTPPLYQQNIQDAIATAVETWQNNIEAPNHLVFLASAVEPTAKIINESVQQWESPSLEVITPLKDLQRPLNPRYIKKQICQALADHSPIKTSDFETIIQTLPEDAKQKRKTLIIIPALEQCFLRCIGGWESIEYLREVIVQNRDCFWVIGCSAWAWNFLDFVCQISAYFDPIHNLPELAGENLEKWLTSRAENLVNLDQPESSNNDPRPAYWEFIANQSCGVSSIAQYLWLQSLRLKQAEVENLDLDAINFSPSPKTDQRLNVYSVKPSLPSLPTLTNFDRYILHAILIHGIIHRHHLSHTLGESESQIQTRIQWLLKQEILIIKGVNLSVHPLFYLAIKSDLENNNFFIG
ncbi:hypothetical protein K4A83_00730 [Spirulina subsalsa FACHB-351]|uniref:MarR family transcriptional regulator n=1 Tax=Spirulina subsalsa FACHB-351 TaxID=234711 RepID=A0ABT3KZW6_9CYAN|nr:hypothetical protein [Spirulina subsalsa]MCW6034803.1 hypothetical protein [Spirulina subsalsa FACHB-351]